MHASMYNHMHTHTCAHAHTHGVMAHLSYACNIHLHCSPYPSTCTSTCTCPLLPDLRASDSMYCRRYRAQSWCDTTAARSTITFSKGSCISFCRHTHGCDEGEGRGERALHQCGLLVPQLTLMSRLHSSHLALTSFITLVRPWERGGSACHTHNLAPPHPQLGPTTPTTGPHHTHNLAPPHPQLGLATPTTGPHHTHYHTDPTPHLLHFTTLRMYTPPPLTIRSTVVVSPTASKCPMWRFRVRA